jgi:hypothetical protein
MLIDQSMASMVEAIGLNVTDRYTDRIHRVQQVL